MASTHTLRTAPRRIIRQLGLGLGIGMLLVVTGCGAEKQPSSESNVERGHAALDSSMAKSVAVASQAAVKWTGAEFHEQAQAALVTNALLVEPDNFFEQLSKCVKGEKQGDKCDLLVERAKALNGKLDDNSSARLYRFQQQLKLTLDIAESGDDDVVISTPVETPKTKS
jgi:hypothetical protein